LAGAGETVFEQRAADRKRKVQSLLAGAASEEPGDTVRTAGKLACILAAQRCPLLAERHAKRVIFAGCC
jgi:hypothetical protein